MGILENDISTYWQLHSGCNAIKYYNEIRKNKYGHIMSSTVPNIKIRTFALIHWFLIYEDFCVT